MSIPRAQPEGADEDDVYSLSVKVTVTLAMASNPREVKGKFLASSAATRLKQGDSFKIYYGARSCSFIAVC